MKGIYVNFIISQNVIIIFLGLDPTCNHKSLMTQWWYVKPSVGNIALMLMQVDLVINKSNHEHE